MVFDGDATPFQERYQGLYGIDETVDPPIPMVGLLSWDGSAWEKMESTGGNLVTNIQGYNGTNYHPAGIDTITRSLLTMDYGHHEVHAGSRFITCDVQNVNTATMKWQITTPDTTKWAHILFDVDCTGEIDILVTEGSDRTDGTALTEVNRDRNSGTAATMIVTRTPTGGSTDGAVTIMHKRTGFTNSPGKTISTGGARGLNEYILKQNTKYVVAITTYANVNVSFCVDWYEHTNKAT